MNLDRNNASQRDDFLLFFVADELLIGTSLLVSKVRQLNADNRCSRPFRQDRLRIGKAHSVAAKALARALRSCRTAGAIDVQKLREAVRDRAAV